MICPVEIAREVSAFQTVRVREYEFGTVGEQQIVTKSKRSDQGTLCACRQNLQTIRTILRKH